MKWNVPKVSLSLSNFASSGLLSSKRGVPTGPSTMILKPDTDNPQASSLSLAAQLPTTAGTQRMGGTVTAHGFFFVGTVAKARQRSSPHVSGSTPWMKVHSGCQQTLKRFALSRVLLVMDPTPRQRLGSCFCFNELVLRTQWKTHLASEALYLLTDTLSWRSACQAVVAILLSSGAWHIPHQRKQTGHVSH